MARKVLVTGGCGFLGSHVCEFYHKKGWDVIAYDNMTKHELQRTGFLTQAARNYNSNNLRNQGITVLIADIRNNEQLLDSTSGCDFIIHTAAQPAMTIGWEDPRLDMTTNVLGTFNVLECARQHTIPVASCATIHIYGNHINNNLAESEKRYTNDPQCFNENLRTLEGTLTPLHASKSSADTYIRTYIDTYQLEAASFRLSGIYGTNQFGGEDHGWVAHFCIRSVLDIPIKIFGTGKQVRDIIYATDVCEAFDAFYTSRKSGVYNIGGGKKTAISLLECIDLIEKLRGKRPVVEFYPSRKGDLSYFICDITKACLQMNWLPKVLPAEGVEQVLSWVEKNEDIFMEKEHQKS